MSVQPQIKGWCPGALRPMMSGDGLVVRVRPFGGRLSAGQAKGLARLANRYGNGLLDLSSRANLQLRGITEDAHSSVIKGLQELALVDPLLETEQRRNILVQPFWQMGDETQRLAAKLERALAQHDAPELPGKFGFAVDTGPVPVLQNASADIRLERSAEGGLLLAADGMDLAKNVSSESAIDEAIALAHWFAAQRGRHRRMSALVAKMRIPEMEIRRQVGKENTGPMACDTGVLCGLELGQISAATLEKLAAEGALRMTPWRMVLVEGATDLPKIDGIITDLKDPLLRVIACTGAPRCAQGNGATRPLARQLAPHLKESVHLHVSGCAKGCAQPRGDVITVTAVSNGLAFGSDARAADPTATLTSDDIIQTLKAI